VNAVFQPHRRVKPEDVVFALEAPAKPVEVHVHAIDGRTPPEEVVASVIESRKDGGWSCVFGGWDLVRFLQAKDVTTEFSVELRGTFDDQTEFLAHARLELALKTGKKK
jgi:hypothetical protein